MNANVLCKIAYVLASGVQFYRVRKATVLYKIIANIYFGKLPAVYLH
jgi:hypothetical protein